MSDERKGRGDWTLVRDGTACGEKLICVNQTCESLYPYIEPGHCETNNNALECSGHGVSIVFVSKDCFYDRNLCGVNVTH